MNNRQPPAPATGERWAWRRWLLPRSYLVASTFLYLGVLGSFLYRTLGMGCHCPWSTHAGMVGATAALLVLERVLQQRHGDELPRGAALWSLGLHAALFELIAYLDSFSMSPFFYLLLPFLARLQLGRAAGRVVTALVLLRYTVGLWLIRPDWYRAPGPLNDWLIFAIGLIFVSMLAEMVVREREQRTELGRVLADLAESHRQLQVYAAQVAALSKAEERNRLARDIHDSLGHYLTVINVQLCIQEGIEVVGTAENGAQAVEQAVALQADVVLMDVRMPVMDGVAAAAELRRQAPDCRVLMLTTFDDEAYILAALRAGAVGYLLKDLPAQDLARAVHAAHGGVYQLDPGVAAKLMGSLAATPPEVPATKAEPAEPLATPLSRREVEVIRLIANGLSNREIAQALVVSEGTVKNHISNLLSRLGLRDRTQAALYAREHGLLD